MTEKPTCDELDNPVDLDPRVSATDGDFQLLCCSASPVCWVTAAELIYEFTREPGKVVRNTISFDIDKDQRIDVDLLDGRFEIFKGNETTGVTGRKGLDLLMKWKGMSLEEAQKYIADKYSEDHATLMTADLQKMRITEKLQSSSAKKMLE